MEQPKWYNYMYPILKILSDGSTISRNELKERAARFLNLTPELMAERLPNSPETFRFSDRAGWALAYLKQSGLIDTPVKRGQYSITDSGKKLLDKKEREGNHEVIEEDLESYQSYLDFKQRKKHKDKQENDIRNDTPNERLIYDMEEYKAPIYEALIKKAQELSPRDFETLVIRLLVKMGYSDEKLDIGKARTGGAGDCGIDGVINQDKLGLDTIYVQAKRYKSDNIVSPHDVRDFIGSVTTAGKGSKKGIFITTSDFTKEGIMIAQKPSDVKIVLINGRKLAELMYEYNIGVTVDKTYVTKKIDEDDLENN